jgi:hypothetical protein
MRRAGLQNAALYLIRPDGYIALADPRPTRSGCVIISLKAAVWAGMAAKLPVTLL